MEGQEQIKDFSWALAMLREGKKVFRAGWHGRGLSIELQNPDENSKMTLPYIYLNVPVEEMVEFAAVPWVASQTDILSDDWEEYQEEEAGR